MDENQQPVPAAPVNPDEIEDVNQSIKLYKRSHLGTRLLIFFSTIILILGAFILWIATHGSFPFQLIFLPIAIPFVHAFYIRNKLLHQFMHQFAAENNFSYQKEIDTIEGLGSQYLANMGRRRYLQDVIAGQYKGVQLSLYTFSATVGSGKQSHQISFTVFETGYTGDVSDIIMEGTAFKYRYEEFFTGKKQLSLEGDFNKYFKVYVPEGYEIETLEILTPDIMQELIQTGTNLSFEFSNNKLFIFNSKIIESKQELDSIMNFSQTLTQQLAPVLSQLKNEYVK